MTRIVTALTLLLLTAAAIAGPSPGPLERHIHNLERQIEAEHAALGNHPFVHKNASGRVSEAYVVTPQSYSYTRYGSNGVPLSQWTIRRTTPRSTVYEAWYGPKHSKERLQVDDRTVEYTSWWENGQKWEEYTYNVPKNEKAYYVYDQTGHLYP
ncbi:MAG: hypothetical protein ACYCW6_11195 [Candidatus Xenobia bacterium]